MAANNKDERIWSAAVRRAVNRRLEKTEGQPKKIEILADELVERGLAGEVVALKEIGDRLDGKATQQVQASLDGTITVQRIMFDAIEHDKD